MNAEDMLDYALGQLDGPARAQADRELAADPHAAATLARLGRALGRLLDDGEVIEPPPNLAARTLALAADHRRRRRAVLEFAPVKVPFRWADVAVAASIFVAGLLTLLPAVHRSQQRMAQAGCGFNLQQLSLGLAQYAHTHHYYPYANPDCPASHAGTFSAMLHDAGVLDDLRRLDCPCDGACAAIASCRLPDHKGLAALRLKDPERYRKLLCWDYAYNVGYEHEPGRPGPIADGAARSATIPLLADQPPHVGDRHILEGNSPNHGGRGQNVLFSDGHVGWYTTRRVSPQDADLYLNEDRRPGPGARLTDSALLPSLFPFAGR